MKPIFTLVIEDDERIGAILAELISSTPAYSLLGPAGFVSMDDSEMLNQVQIGVTGYPEARGIVEMGGRDTEPADYMVTEVLIRSFYDYYRKAMGL